jgi:RNA polymerase sigma-70 factor (ECF subfamily)
VIRGDEPLRRGDVAEPAMTASKSTNPTGTWEREVHRRLVQGDEQALGEIYDQYASFVNGLATKVTCHRHAAEEITQDVFVTIWEQPERFDPDRGSLRSWLGTLAHRRSVDWVRREEARRRREDREANAFVPPPDIAELATSMVIAERIRVAVDALPPEQREALLLAYFGGKTYRQVAEVLEIPEGTAKSRLRLALHRIADALEAEGIPS